jgi:hypothetical protein
MTKAKIKRRTKGTRENKGFSIPSYSKFDLYLWADYFELVCLADKDQSLSKGQAFDLLELPLRDSLIDKEEFEEKNGPIYSLANYPQGKKDSLRFFCDELFKMFEYRANVYGRCYPFKLTKGFLQFNPTLSIKQKLYIYLVTCSKLRHFSDNQSKLTSEFEKISKESLIRMLAPRAEVHHFGATGRPSRYAGSLFDKIALLAKDLDCDVAAQPTDFSKHNAGDGGLDIVAWYPFKDLKWSRMILLAQCKCSDSWVEDRFSSSLDAWTGKIHFKQPISNVTFIPFCYRRICGKWHSAPHVSGTILIDRQRLIDCLGEDLNFFNKYESFKFVSERFFKSR